MTSTDVILSLSISQTNSSSKERNEKKIRDIHLLGIIRINFFDRPPPFSIDLESWNDLKRDVLSVIANIIEREDEDKRRWSGSCAFDEHGRLIE